MPSSAFRFLDLPPELRERIYVLIATHPYPYIPLDAPQPHLSFPLNLLLTSSQIYQEVRPVYFTNNFFSLTIRRRNPEWDFILDPGWTDNRRQIRALRIAILRWGTKDFFCKRIVPALEDCILNGKLRVLEVLIKGSHVKRVGRNFEEYENLKALRRIIRDPYLEKVEVRAGPLDELEVQMFWDWEMGDRSLFQDITKLLHESGSDKIGIANIENA